MCAAREDRAPRADQGHRRQRRSNQSLSYERTVRFVSGGEKRDAPTYDQANDVRDKVVAKGAISCTTPDGLELPAE